MSYSYIFSKEKKSVRTILNCINHLHSSLTLALHKGFYLISFRVFHSCWFPCCKYKQLIEIISWERLRCILCSSAWSSETYSRFYFLFFSDDHQLNEFIYFQSVQQILQLCSRLLIFFPLLFNPTYRCWATLSPRFATFFEGACGFNSSFEDITFLELHKMK